MRTGLGVQTCALPILWGDNERVGGGKEREMGEGGGNSLTCGILSNGGLADGCTSDGLDLTATRSEQTSMPQMMTTRLL